MDFRTLCSGHSGEQVVLNPLKKSISLHDAYNTSHPFRLILSGFIHFQPRMSCPNELAYSTLRSLINGVSGSRSEKWPPRRRTDSTCDDEFLLLSELGNRGPTVFLKIQLSVGATTDNEQSA